MSYVINHNAQREGHLMLASKTLIDNDFKTQKNNVLTNQKCYDYYIQDQYRSVKNFNPFNEDVLSGDIINGGVGELILGTTNDDIINAHHDGQTVVAGDGDDNLYAKHYNVVLYGGKGNDTYYIETVKTKSSCQGIKTIIIYDGGGCTYGGNNIIKLPYFNFNYNNQSIKNVKLVYNNNVRLSYKLTDDKIEMHKLSIYLQHINNNNECYSSDPDIIIYSETNFISDYIADKASCNEDKIGCYNKDIQAFINQVADTTIDGIAVSGGTQNHGEL